MNTWTILTCEYPPQFGGVGDYTAQVAAALAAAGDEVTVYCPPMPSQPVRRDGIEVIPLPDAYGPRSRQAIDDRLNVRPSTIFAQYVPTAFGMKGANVPWCRWLLRRARHHDDDVRVMFHEPYFEFVWASMSQNALAVAQRIMARTLLRAATHTYVSTDAWRPYLAPLAPADQRPFVTLPIPSAIPRCDRPGEVAARRAALLGSQASHIVGHFGTYGSHIAPMLMASLTTLLSEERKTVAVCVGKGSEDFVRALLASRPDLAGRVNCIGRAAAPDVSVVLSACDLLLQPYPDGVTTRRTSVMAGLINGRAVLTTTGHLTEPVWAETRAVAIEPAGDVTAFVHAACKLLWHDGRRTALAARAEETYRQRFALTHTIGRLREAVAPVAV
jgi:glycosyltransferase involved in cell wall biosynthesis